MHDAQQNSTLSRSTLFLHQILGLSLLMSFPNGLVLPFFSPKARVLDEIVPKQGRVTFNVLNCTQIYTHSPFYISIHLDVFLKPFSLICVWSSPFSTEIQKVSVDMCHQANVPINLQYWDFHPPDFLGVEIEQRYPVPDLGSQPPGGSGSLPELMIQFRQEWQTGKR